MRVRARGVARTLEEGRELADPLHRDLLQANDRLLVHVLHQQRLDTLATRGRVQVLRLAHGVVVGSAQVGREHIVRDDPRERQRRAGALQHGHAADHGTKGCSGGRGGGEAAAVG